MKNIKNIACMALSALALASCSSAAADTRFEAGIFNDYETVSLDLESKSDYAYFYQRKGSEIGKTFLFWNPSFRNSMRADFQNLYEACYQEKGDNINICFKGSLFLNDKEQPFSNETQQTKHVFSDMFSVKLTAKSTDLVVFCAASIASLEANEKLGVTEVIGLSLFSSSFDENEITFNQLHYSD